MTRPVPLKRLRDISKQRTIRRPLLVPVPPDSGDGEENGHVTKIEWPISG